MLHHLLGWVREGGGVCGVGCVVRVCWGVLFGVCVVGACVGVFVSSEGMHRYR